MDDEAIGELIARLNSALGEYTPYKLALVDPAKVRGVERNARYMSKRMFDQLTRNIQRDRNLSSLPFCWQAPTGELVSLSGNHRIQAAISANVPRILVLFTDDGLSKQQQTAIQLSHNALVGKDEPNALLELWQDINDVGLKLYSGLDDEYLQTLDPVSVLRFDESRLRMEEILLLFIGAEVEQMDRILKRLQGAGRRKYIAEYHDFDRFFETLLEFKEAANVVNTSSAVRMLIEIAREWLEHNAAERNKEADESEKQAG